MTLVLVVDDDQDLAEMLGIVLTGAGIDVDLVSRGDEALEVFRNNPPDLVLLDVMLPGLDGIEVCKELRQIADFKDTLIVFLTANLISSIIAIDITAIMDIISKVVSKTVPSSLDFSVIN